MRIPPTLSIIQCGKGHEMFIRQKKIKAKEVGIELNVVKCHIDPSEVIHQLNKNPRVDGILLQLPVDNEYRYIDLISPEKDVDGLTSSNAGLLWRNSTKALAPCP